MTPVLRTATVVGCAAVATALIAGCASSSGTSHSSSAASAPAGSATPGPALASASAQGLTVSGGYIPAPASPDVAAAYLVLTNTTGTAITLQKVVTSVTKDVMAMNETDSGGVGSMTDLSTVRVPAHGSVQFVPNHAHFMLQNPAPLKAGDRVSMTLTFTTVGSITLSLPVIPLTEVPTSAPPSSGSVTSTHSMAPMPGMAGMSMSGS